MLESDNRIFRRRAGQTLVIAIMVMFILALVAAIFIGLVARNLFRAERLSNVDVVAQLAEAGIRYADLMLTSSEDGADWRPIPDNIGAATPGDPITDTPPTPAAGWDTMRDRHPDWRWVRAYWYEELPAGAANGQGFAGPSGGYTAFDSGQGRFLLRLSYNPNPNDPLSKYIKIESIGRFGFVKNDDPTTWKPYADVNLRREITAYKPIGVTDYLRFVTNKDRRSLDFPLGCPGFQMTFGRSSGSRNGYRGGPIRVNGNMVWYGNQQPGSIQIFLRGVHPLDDTGNEIADKLIPLDRVEVAGEIKCADNATAVLNRLNPDGSVVDTVDLLTSQDPSFTTGGGFYRDGSDSTDVRQVARGVRRIEAPIVDQPDPSGQTTRYRLLTLNSGERIDKGGTWVNLGALGWGRGVYINNLSDVQDESETLFGGYTLRTDWLKPNNPLSPNWKGPYYVPPAAIITLLPDRSEVVDGRKQYYFTITRTDSPDGQNPTWCDAWGAPRPEWGRTVVMPYPDPNWGREVKRGAETKHIDGNGVIYAEGNIRVRGMLPPEMQLTIVSNENIYIDGNVLKYRDHEAEISPTDPWRGADESCGLALLARKNIVVNTTQFFSPRNTISADDVGSDARDGSPPFHLIVSAEPASRPELRFEFGPYESETGTAPRDWWVFVRHSGEYGPSYINAWLNSGLLRLNSTYPGFTQFTPLPDYIWGVGDPNFNPPGWGIGSSFVCDVFPLNIGAAALMTAPGLPNWFNIALDQTTYTRNDYLMGGLAVQPMDVRIEAILYAQEGSFYVIPGNWFNSIPTDVRGAPQRPGGVKNEFPFFGEPLDIRIIVDGAVGENMPPPIGDTEEWMSKWGRIPDTYGASSVSTAHPGEGITFLYDDHVAWPLVNLRNGGARSPIRTDKFGRILPIAPRLPVSGSLLYFGDVM